MKKLKKRANKAAARYLELKGMRILDRNWKCDGLAGKFDLVANDHGAIVFVTVSTATLMTDLGFREEPISREQAELLGAAWLAEHAGELDAAIQVRFDRIALLVLTDDRAMLRHNINVFGCMES
ncbi:MAG: YraN family protein [Eggerthellaceae bacterium]|nr:YraN family protein [Eggerthellaceae bacterium]